MATKSKRKKAASRPGRASLPAPEPVDSRLTPLQLTTLRAFKDHLDSHGEPPTIGELSVAIGLTSPKGAQKHLEGLMDKLCVQWEPEVRRKPRGLTKLGERTLKAEYERQQELARERLKAT